MNLTHLEGFIAVPEAVSNPPFSSKKLHHCQRLCTNETTPKIHFIYLGNKDI